MFDKKDQMMDQDHYVVPALGQLTDGSQKEEEHEFEVKKPAKKKVKTAARTPKRESLVCVLVRTAAAGQKIKFEWNYFEELQKNERVLDRYESLDPFEFRTEDEPAWYREPVPDLPAEKYRTFQEFMADQPKPKK